MKELELTPMASGDIYGFLPTAMQKVINAESKMEVLNPGSTVESPKELQSVKSVSGAGFGHVDPCSGSGDSSRASSSTSSRAQEHAWTGSGPAFLLEEAQWVNISFSGSGIMKKSYDFVIQIVSTLQEEKRPLCIEDIRYLLGDVHNYIFDIQFMGLSKLYLETGLLKASFIHLYHEINSNMNSRYTSKAQKLQF
ncbi:hypothetical protein JEQ12_012377 [Ovis aries]|uniref:Uncharacterized protein n=1 Tax=Ovis aries TaxID=9940 RepID=A0A835ZKR3_SHEEP|nr:hypothetical protein JEQ12_012377 [Ovis aries]